MTVVTPPTSTTGTRDIALRDGSSVHVRPVRGADRDAIRVFLAGMSPDSAYFRCCGLLDPDRLADWAVDVNLHDRYGILATVGPDEQIIGHAAYIRANARRAEIAFEVADAMHGQGIGTLLLAQLAAVATTQGISEFSAEVMPANHKMLELFRSSGYTIRYVKTDDLTEMVFDTALSTQTIAAFDRREREAGRSALRRFLEPESVAVIGASPQGDSVGGQVMANLLTAGFSGALYPVNPRHRNVEGHPALKTIGHAPAPVDLAVITVPTSDVLDIARQCGTAGVRALVVMTAGFAEEDEAGLARQRELLHVCRGAGMRLIGPNSLGVFNTAPAHSLNASLIRTMPARGRVGLMSQSGGVGVALTAGASRLGIGLSSFVSVGNKADISGNDLLAYWDEDPNTDVILLYLESFGNPRRFARYARHVAASKPILAVKSGPTPIGTDTVAGSRAAQLLAASDIGVDALFRQAGVIRTDTTGELLEAAVLLASQPAPRGSRVGLVSNSRGPARLCSDACRAAGLDVIDPSHTRLSPRLQRVVGTVAGRAGRSLDLTATATAADYREATTALAQAGACDAIIALFVPSVGSQAHDVLEAIDAVDAEHPDISFAAVVMDRLLPSSRPGRSGHAARFGFPEEAARALGHAARWSGWRAQATDAPKTPDGLAPEQARNIIARNLASGSGWLDDAEAHRLLDCYGLAPTPTTAEDPDERRLLAGVVQDADFGPLLVCGRPGAQVAVRITPVGERDIAEMVQSLGNPLSDGGSAATIPNPSALADALMRLGSLVEHHPEITAVDIDPLGVRATGIRIGSARVHIDDRPETPAPGSLR